MTRRRARRTGLACVAAMLLALGCGSAQAHAYLQRSEPPANAALTRQPPELRLRFSEAVEPAFIEVDVQRNGQALTGLAAARLDPDGKTVRLALPDAQGTADYGVHWRIVAKDGHPTEGRFTFRVAPK